MKILLLVTLISLIMGCASFKDWLGENVSENIPLIGEEPPLKYSETPQAGVMQDRKYNRMTRSRMEEEAELQSNAGSLWVMEGQTSYMFAQNKVRREGDALNVKLEGAGMKQVETKANNIKSLMKELEEEEKKRRGEVPATGQTPLAENQKGEAKSGDRNPAGAPAVANAAKANEKPKEEKVDLSDIQNVPAKIVERMTDGNYRIKGSQSFVIEKKEYKVILTGVIKAEDFNDEGVSSGKLIDPQYDVVSIRRANKNEDIL